MHSCASWEDTALPCEMHARLQPGAPTVGSEPASPSLGMQALPCRLLLAAVADANLLPVRFASGADVGVPDGAEAE
jgi:hypothetical protein